MKISNGIIVFQRIMHVSVNYPYNLRGTRNVRGSIPAEAVMSVSGSGSISVVGSLPEQLSSEPEEGQFGGMLQT